MAKRYLARSRAPEDVTGLAGWLFTDLLLGLVMVFISAVAFVAYKNADDESTIAKNFAERTSAFVEVPFSKTFEKGEGSDINKLIEKYIEDHKKIFETFEKPKVAVGIIYGSYLEGGSANDGVKTAKSFYDRFRESDPDNFPAFSKDRKVPNMRFIGSAGEYAPKDGAGVELFFVYDACSKYEYKTAPTTTTP